MGIDIIKKQTYCGNCGAKYQYEIEKESYLVRGDWFGHHPDHYETSTISRLNTTPCPKCKKINHKEISLIELEYIDIPKMNIEEKFIYIFSEKININNKQIEEKQNEIKKLNEDINKMKADIKVLLKDVNWNKEMIRINNETINEINKTTIDSYNEHRIKQLRNENRYLNNKVIKLFKERKTLLEVIDRKEENIKSSENIIFKLKQENKFYKYTINK